MGLTGAAQYFQRVLSTYVLNGLIMIICELYLDDIIIPARSEDEFIVRLTAVLNRFRDKKIAINPAKCVLGIEEVEYVGHTINKDGIHFSRAKLEGILNIPAPATHKDMKSFLGVANYFRDHINNHSILAHPLNQMILDYSPKKRLSWSKEQLDAFYLLRKSINECPLLFFLDDVSPIFLDCDACLYGFGGYLYQIINGKFYPIGFVSKSFDSTQINWSMPEKEGYAIFFCLVKWEYLLRDRKFTTRTDHDNLVKLRELSNSMEKVRRWFRSFQSYDNFHKGN